MTSRAFVTPSGEVCAPASNPKYGGRSIVEMMEQHLDNTRKTGNAMDEAKAIGIVEAIAIMRDPYAWVGDTHRSWGKAVNSVWEASDERLDTV